MPDPTPTSDSSQGKRRTLRDVYADCSTALTLHTEEDFIRAREHKERQAPAESEARVGHAHWTPSPEAASALVGLLPSMRSAEPSMWLRNFTRAACAHGWVTDFDWCAWQMEARNLVEESSSFDTVDFETLRRLLTLHIRKNRFCEGYLEDVARSGYLTRLTERLAQLTSAVR